MVFAATGLDNKTSPYEYHNELEVGRVVIRTCT